MKRLNLIITTVLAAGMLQACHSSNSTTQSADSANAKNDSAKNDTSAKMTMTTDKDDAKFAVTLANGGLTEVAVAKIAEEKATDKDLKDFAKMMIKDHSAANEKLMDIAKSKNITLPAAPDTSEKSKMDDLAKKSGNDFNKAYIDMMVKDHKNTADLLEDEAKNGKDSTLKTFAGSILPTVNKHLGVITAIQAKMK